MAFRMDKLTIKAQESVANGQELAADQGHPQFDPLHLLTALIKEESGIVRPILNKIGVNVEQLGTMLEAELKRLRRPVAAHRHSLVANFSKFSK